MNQPQAKRYTQPREVFARPVGDELMLLHAGSEVYHGLDAIGRECFNLLVSGNTAEEVAAAVASEYGISADRVQSDVQQLISDLVTNGLLVEDEAPSDVFDDASA